MHLLAVVADPSEAPLNGLEAISAGNGVAIAVTGLLIVFVALVAISLFIGALPMLLKALGPWLPEIESHHDQPAAPRRQPAAASDGVDPRLVAAIGWAVHASRRSD